MSQLKLGPERKHKSNKLTLIDYYGKDWISLYRGKSECYLFIPGVGRKGSVKGLAYWTPENPNLMFIFPYTNKATEAEKIFNKSFEDKYSNHSIKTKNSLHYENKYYPLYTLGKLKYSIFIQAVNLGDDSSMMRDGNRFAVYIYDPRNGSYERLWFGLSGLREAVSNYNKYCRGGK